MLDQRLTGSGEDDVRFAAALLSVLPYGTGALHDGDFRCAAGGRPYHAHRDVELEERADRDCGAGGGAKPWRCMAPHEWSARTSFQKAFRRYQTINGRYPNDSPQAYQRSLRTPGSADRADWRFGRRG